MFFLVQVHTQSVISVLKNTVERTPDDTYKAVLLPVDAVTNLDTWVPPIVANSVKTRGPPEGLPPRHLHGESGHH